jgi:hypothetical protein
MEKQPGLRPAENPLSQNGTQADVGKRVYEQLRARLSRDGPYAVGHHR